MENFGQRLRRLRGDRSQREVATGLGIPPTTLSTLENQETVPRGETLQKLAEYFKVPMSYFFRQTNIELKGSDSARAWLQHLQQPVVGKDTVATQANASLDEDIKEQIAQRLRKRHAEISSHKQ
jgi:transcriptional regulator with XRE-family HTH domain